MAASLSKLYIALLRFGFRLLYREMAWSYDAVSWLVSFGAWREWQRAALPNIQGPHVLEIGHGPGHMLLALHEAGHQVVGLDPSPQMGAISRRRLRNAGVQLPLLRAKAQHLPFPAATFDSVLATFPTGYLLAQETITAVYRVLRQNGRFVIIPSANLTGNSLPVRFVEWLYLITGQRPQRQILPKTPAVTSPITFQDQIKTHFRQAGFQTTIETTSLAHSEVTIIIAEKKIGE